MYQRLIRPLLFLFDPEKIHHFVSFLLRFGCRIPGMPWLLKKIYVVNHPSLEREVFGIRFPNPVGIAAGFDKEAKLFNELACFGFSHVEVGTVTPKGQPGNPRPRLFRLPADQALINRMGFNNAGVEVFASNLRKNKAKLIIGGNIGKNTLTPNDQAIEDYCRCFSELFDLVDYFVVNVSCPNIADLAKLQDKDELLVLLNAVQKINLSKPIKKPVLLKIAPDLNTGQLDEVIEIVEETGIDGIIATNTSTLRYHLSTPAAQVEQIGNGGLSGKPLRETSSQVIKYLHEKSGGKIPIIGVGGIMTAEDALEKLRAGASLVQVYTGFIYSGPAIARKINKALLRSGIQ
ncbi:MAG: quinone-dependent dihydroorotate dehydrogenase [Bacteroides sp.]|jgi:dihydroorotate dehydrogenase|nr:quinone-dependent dihydroorotate dehydrogenase [Bacteroides sp.]